MTTPRSTTPTLGLLLTGLLAAAALGQAACGSADRRPDLWADGPREPVLLSTSGGFELHIVDGRVVEVVPATEPGATERTRIIASLDELRTLYEGSTGRPLPVEATPGVIQVNGWRGLECLRAGRACGPAPDVAPQAMVILRFR